MFPQVKVKHQFANKATSFVLLDTDKSALGEPLAVEFLEFLLLLLLSLRIYEFDTLDRRERQ